jgi:hypothetical protein
MGNGSNIIRHSHAKKCFVCGKYFEGNEHKNDNGTVTPFIYVHMGDPSKYERLCYECNEENTRMKRLEWEKHVAEVLKRQNEKENRNE